MGNQSFGTLPIQAHGGRLGVTDRARFLTRAVALVSLIALVTVLVQGTNSSTEHRGANERIEQLKTKIVRANQDIFSLHERLTYAKSVPAIREIAKRDLGLVDPGDRALIILDDLTNLKRSTRAAPILQETLPSKPVEFGHIRAWLTAFFGT
ncbi:MAG TPA: hypothetical protein DGO43_08625 [Chloroflexi bacterium]|nr:hypothetical protein [Chloroflexota bacterium]